MSQPTGKQLVKALKEAAGGDGPALVIPVGCPPVAMLRPVATRAGRLREGDLIALTEWRNRFVASFLTEFEATVERTSRWLCEVVGPRDNKVLFMADDPAGRTFGYMGLDYIDWEQRRGEADAIVRGGDAPAGTMGRCMTTLLGWARRQLELETIGVRVRSDNPALRFYTRNGFVEYQRKPLRRFVEGDMVRWVESDGSDPELSLVYLRWLHPTDPDAR